ncbi:Glycoside hydrolase family 19 protein [Dioscorea alata]|uniref:Glycoside hydrolase family 19 protein n=1 Tax=Dioscorea alata TaxID=55571 RepID=A0ACB7VB87_DIOAL|nr:Glycoside hydrolase family 19 protein [Dioscorea alata]
MHSFTIIILEALLLAGVLSGLFSSSAKAKNCDCDLTIYCCSQWGYRGNGDAYCGPRCQAGPCEIYCEGTGTLTVSDIVTQEFFQEITSQARADCAGNGFYNLSAFLEAASSFPDFGTTCTDDDRKREIAAYFAHVTHETKDFCYIEEIDGQALDYCDESQGYPCNPSKKYFGRGPLQLSWNYNYIQAGQDIVFDGLNDPDIVALDPVISFKTSLWIWMKKEMHNAIISGQGFGATIRIINDGLECDGGNTAQMMARVEYYRSYCAQLGVSPGNDLTCLTKGLFGSAYS